MRIGKLAGAALAATAALLLAACQQSETSIKIGFIDPLSGAFANVGAHGQRELQLVIEDINQRGGVLGGKKFEIVAGQQGQPAGSADRDAPGQSPAVAAAICFHVQNDGHRWREVRHGAHRDGLWHRQPHRGQGHRPADPLQDATAVVTAQQEKKKAAVFRGLFICSGRAYMRFAAAGRKV